MVSTCFRDPVVVQLSRFVNEARTDRFFDNYIYYHLFLPRKTRKKKESVAPVNVSLSLFLVDRSKKTFLSKDATLTLLRRTKEEEEKEESSTYGIGGPKFAFKKAGPRARR